MVFYMEMIYIFGNKSLTMPQMRIINLRLSRECGLRQENRILKI